VARARKLRAGMLSISMWMPAMPVLSVFWKMPVIMLRRRWAQQMNRAFTLSITTHHTTIIAPCWAFSPVALLSPASYLEGQAGGRAGRGQ